MRHTDEDHGTANAEEQEIDGQAAGHAEERLALLPTGRVAHGRSIRTGLTMEKVWMRYISIMCIEQNMVLMCSFLACAGISRKGSLRHVDIRQRHDTAQTLHI